MGNVNDVKPNLPVIVTRVVYQNLPYFGPKRTCLHIFTIYKLQIWKHCSDLKTPRILVKMEFSYIELKDINKNYNCSGIKNP